ncbi:putative protein N-terminal asparagine amidohydrolase [Schistosoma mansoni]|uniref:RHD domain-containing protein n=1 Tax=Schistosoma mansoni TaxID=6183 RepID=G4VAZ0_SCHMA|nr:putative protein N-terminal asparagine amidohydrolase [Schistosoma mansoni]|eukprot:XP_018648434.1 putative protein N-terminal asparagine amidohydrolase [Schistosoma mansoni]
MVLNFDGKRYNCEKSSIYVFAQWFSTSSFVKSIADDFKKSQSINVEDCLSSVYVHQGEMATIPLLATNVPTSNIIPEYTTSDDATSCYIVVLRCSLGCSIGHLDTPLRVRSFFRNSERFFFSKGSVNVTVHIVGGFPDPRNISHSILVEILSSLTCNDHSYELGVCCIGENNILSSSGEKSQPAILGVIFSIKTNQINPARISWKARGPVPVLRLLRLECVDSDEITNVFNPERGYLIINPFLYVRPAFVNAQITSEEMRAKSTTPEQEPATYFEGQIAVHRIRFHCSNSLRWFERGPLMFRCVLDSNKPWVPLNEASAVASEDPLTNVKI